MMKNCIPLVFAILLCMSACKKENQGANNGIVGKWYENKLELRSRNGNTLVKDTVFIDGAFTKMDYFQFTSDGKAIFSQSGVYDFTGKSIATSGGVTVIGMAHYSWAIADSALLLNNTDRNPSTEYLPNQIETRQTILQLDAHRLVLRSQFLGDGPFNLTSISYFTKGN